MLTKPMQKEAKQTKTLGFGAEKVLLSFFTIEQVSCSIDTNSLMVFREEFLNVTFW